MGASSSSRTDNDLGASKTMALAFMRFILTQADRPVKIAHFSDALRMKPSEVSFSALQCHFEVLFVCFVQMEIEVGKPLCVFLNQ
jgi:hypothetical protein